MLPLFSNIIQEFKKKFERKKKQGKNKKNEKTKENKKGREEKQTSASGSAPALRRSETASLFPLRQAK